uniref:Ubiquitin-like protease family profile domain-containing protein n=1 Tax=Panagrolaimus sp. JU765 TaxID=591449 RepID=A0AC34QWG6_9BILA
MDTRDYGHDDIADFYFYRQDYVFIPIVHVNHHFLVVVVNPNGAIQTIHDFPEISKIIPITKILIFDSKTDATPDPIDTHKRIYTLVKMFLYFSYYRNSVIAPGIVDDKRYEQITVNVPQQGNAYDCGFYVMKIVEKFFKNPPDLSNCLLLCLFEASLFLLWSVAVDNSSLSSNSTFLAAEPIIKQVGDKLKFLKDGTVQLNVVDSVFFLEVFDGKIVDLNKGVHFCFKAKNTTSKSDNCPENYCDIFIKNVDYGQEGKDVLLFVSMGSSHATVDYHNGTFIEIRETFMFLNNDTLISRDCTWDTSLGYLEAKLINMNHRIIYLSNTKIRVLKNDTMKNSDVSDEMTVGGVIGFGTIAALVLAAILIGAFCFCRIKIKDKRNVKKNSKGTKHVVAIAAKGTVKMEDKKVEEPIATTAPIVQDAVQEVPTTNKEEKK